ncbi:TetR-like C-terminal domain-containing protein [Nocardioides alcanivorans]|uniref:TetR-like C-terminal domain-containing protein n=1 Tax=Nocardioides alcanivorans TaxID=2897352 RepID=UPI001F2403A6|nr:TetR-like C-terminal domain-containing protein [Nocardioides alcanivorans]
MPDTGSLREDLREFAAHALIDPELITIMAAVLTAVHRDADFAGQFRERFLGPKIRAMHGIYERARARGELRDDIDIELLGPALPGIVLHRAFVLGDPPTREQMLTLIDQVILRAACP